MEVSHVDDMTTHVVMSNQKAMPVTILDSPELMSMLSGALYKNPAYAMVREIICNAQDAHIEAGIPDTPIQIEVTDSRFIVRDYGKGIPHEDMAEVYGTYGRSTKKKLSTSTGGFGLGSKSPWSFTDIFGVTSYCDGTKTLYRLVRSDMENGGKPGIIPILNTETKETGLEVSIPITPDKIISLKKYITQVVKFGDIPATLDGQLIETLPLNQAKNGYTILSPDVELLPSFAKIFIRYGSVIYPLEMHEAFRDEYREIVRTRPGLRDGYSVILQAQPNTLSIAPSRDHLTLETRTIQTVKSLLQDFSDKFSETKDYTQDILNHFKANPEHMYYRLPYAQSRRDFAIMDSTSAYSGRFRILAQKQEVADYFAQHGIRNKKLYKSLIARVQAGAGHNPTPSWLQKYFVSPLRQWQTTTKIKTNIALYSRASGDLKPMLSAKEHYRWNGELSGIQQLLSLTHRTVVLTTQASGIRQRLPDMDKNPPCFWVISTRSRNLKAILELEKSLTDLGYNVTNLVTLNGELNKTKSYSAPKTRTRTTDPSRYCALRYSLNDGSSAYSRRKAAGKDFFVKTPIAYLEEGNVNFRKVVYNRPAAIQQLLNLLPENIAVVSRSVGKQLAAAGVPHFFDFLSGYLKDWATENKKDIRLVSQITSFIDSASWDCRYVYRSFLNRRNILEAFGFSPSEDFLKVKGKVEILRMLSTVDSPIFKDLPKILDGHPPLTQSKQKALLKFFRSPYIHALNCSDSSYIEDLAVIKALIKAISNYTPKETTYAN